MNDVDLAKRFDGYAKDISKAMETLKGLSQMVLRENQIKQDIPVLEARIEGLHKRKADAEAGIASLEKEFHETHKTKEEEIERRNNESLAKARDLEILLAKNSIKTSELENARKDMEKSKAYYEERVKEYEGKLNEIREKQRRLSEAINA